ncbi:MBL fold metallo-hydrolase [Arthrobacter sp. NQ4]|uniref:MBL fold metallo-hydrolase n=1 Tax=Arthrobacter sp. NQ4 TaxID=3027930 RepID=UPI0023AFF239|nr:MBL fold metallo-hydrolase [Arthrobacter sp. NQ4]MDE8586066.1 MBL fold metallo-hydrolase [Arthrobacter sp. NQ4]
MQTDAPAITITGTAQKEAWQRRVMPPIELVAPGVNSVPVVFPDNPMRYTLSYVLVDGNECVVVDPGFDSEEGHRQLLSALADLGVGPGEITGIVATHFHTDHLGMAARLARGSGAWVALGRQERRHISAFEDAHEESALDQSRMLGWGVPHGRVAEAAMTPEGLLHMRQLADPDRRLGDGDSLSVAGRTWRIMETPGHTPGHICLWDDNGELVLSGDHILPRISPNVSLEIRGDTDPLRQNIASLRRIAGNDHYEVCPAHEYRFRGVGHRARVLEEHIAERSREVLHVLGKGAPTVHEVARRLTWSRGWESLGQLQFRLALSETAAHIRYLVTSGAHAGVPGLVLAD